MIFQINGKTWLMLGLLLLFFFEVVSRPHSEEKRLLRLLEERVKAWVRLRTPLSVRAATWNPNTNAQTHIGYPTCSR